jgi:hydrogenase maturation protein HypF
VLAVGGQLKNTFCLGVGDRLTLGPHVGDLDELSTCESYAAMITRLEQFLSVAPRVLAHDLHPDYESTRYARQRPATRRIAVQHHHAHVAAVMAEHQLEGRVLGVAFDGTGYGTDGSAWGGEFLLATYAGFERAGTTRPLSLAGGERAIRSPWRLAVSVLDDAFGGRADLSGLALFEHVPPRDVENVRNVLAAGLQVTRAHGVGRLFDAASALVLGRRQASFEAQLAMLLEQAAVTDEAPYPYELQRGAGPWEMDLRPMWRALVADVRAGQPAGLLASRFHATLAAGTADLVRALLEREGPLPVVLSGGCFANERLVRETVKRLRGLQVFLPRRVPPGDGGLALGQAVVAQARLRQGSTEGAD